MGELPAAGRGEQSLVLRYRLAPWLCLVSCLAFLAAALAAPADPAGRGTLVFFFIVFGLSAAAGFRTTYEVRQDRLIVSGVLTRRTIVLSALVSAQTVRATGNGRFRPWDLLLFDQQGTAARMNFDGCSPADRLRLLSALAPYVMAAGVRRSGQIENALAGRLWWPGGAGFGNWGTECVVNKPYQALTPRVSRNRPSARTRTAGRPKGSHAWPRASR